MLSEVLPACLLCPVLRVVRVLLCCVLRSCMYLSTCTSGRHLAVHRSGDYTVQSCPSWMCSYSHSVSARCPPRQLSLPFDVRLDGKEQKACSETPFGGCFFRGPSRYLHLYAVQATQHYSNIHHHNPSIASHLASRETASVSPTKQGRVGFLKLRLTARTENRRQGFRRTVSDNCA